MTDIICTYTGNRDEMLVASGVLANYEIRYDASGLSERTGWMPAAKSVADVAPAQAQAAVTRDELVAFGERLRGELRDQQQQPATAAAVPARAEDVDVMRRVKSI